ncbi:MAG: hypothetical protein JXB35_16780 [Anaerolineae bacterium]|nr:hypothetical protein [Anaerolineae bacterium]
MNENQNLPASDRETPVLKPATEQRHPFRKLEWRAVPNWALMISAALLVILGATIVAAVIQPRPDNTVDVATLLDTPEAALPVANDGETPPGNEQPSPEFPTPLPTPIPLPTPTPTPVAPLTTTVAVTGMVPTDPQNDVASLVGAQPVAAPPAGVDIAGCNVSSDTLILPNLAPPFLFPDAGDGEHLVIWLQLQGQVPGERTLNYHWLVALDVDGNPDTGRPPGAGYINPELGAEIGAGVFLYPDGALDPYIFIWDSALADWADDARVPDVVEATLNETQDVVVLSFRLDELRAAIEEIAGVSLDPAVLRGRTGTIASSETTAAVVDFCPDLP